MNRIAPVVLALAVGGVTAPASAADAYQVVCSPLRPAAPYAAAAYATPPDPMKPLTGGVPVYDAPKIPSAGLDPYFDGVVTVNVNRGGPPHQASWSLLRDRDQLYRARNRSRPPSAGGPRNDPAFTAWLQRELEGLVKKPDPLWSRMEGAPFGRAGPGRPGETWNCTINGAP